MEIKLTSKVKFNSKDLMRVVGKHKKDWLYRAGGYLRKAARSRIKTRQGKRSLEKFEFVNEFGRKQPEYFWTKSAVGHSPFDHNGWKKTFSFGVDELAEVVDVGALRGRNHIPPLHEFGGVGTIKYMVFDKRGNKYERTKTHKFEKRPTMKPALDDSIKTISTFWKGVVSNY
jgi:hypothetical protein